MQYNTERSKQENMKNHTKTDENSTKTVENVTFIPKPAK